MNTNYKFKKEISDLSEQNLNFILHSLSPDGSISLSDITELQKFMTKENKLKEIVDLSKVKARPDDGRHYIYIKRKQFIGRNYKDLIESLYEHYFGNTDITLENFFPQWMVWRRDNTDTSNKTLKENIFLWNALYKNTDIVKRPIISLKAKDFIVFFRTLTKDKSITKQRFIDGKSILNSMYNYAVELDIVNNNPLRDINYSQFSYKPVNNKRDLYSLEERKRMLEYLSTKDDIYSLGISLQFSIISRIGELKALKWSDISGNTIRIQSQILEEQSMQDDLSFTQRTHNDVSHVKGATSEGFRDMPLTPNTLNLLEHIKSVNPNSEYILSQDSEPLTTVTYNRHLKVYCEELGIPYRSSHKIRFTVASVLYKNGIDVTKLQEWLGHSQLSTTLHYLRNVDKTDENYNMAVKALD